MCLHGRDKPWTESTNQFVKENTMHRASIIIVYNDKEKLEEASRYIAEQTISSEIELIALDNRDGRFSSAAQALNYGASSAQAEILIFMHQDVYLFDNEAVSKYCYYLTNHRDTIAGIAGRGKSDFAVYGDILEGEEQIQRLTPTNGKAIEVISLDECFFGMHRSLWEKIRFDETTCDDWHYYAVDICYENTLRGGKNVVYSMRVLHKSLGMANPNSFFACTKKMVKKYRGKAERIVSPCINIKCSYFSYLQWLIMKKLVRLKKRLKKD